MRKILIIIGIVAGAIGVLVFGVTKGLVMLEDYSKEVIGANRTGTKVEQGEKEEVAEQTAKIGGIQYTLEIDGNATEEQVVEVMHKMTHQKVRADDKWGAIPMTLETINEIQKIVSASNFNRKEDLLSILNKWRSGDFSTADEDHNYFWKVQGGNIGEAYGVLNEEEEQLFIKNNFKEHAN